MLNICIDIFHEDYVGGYDTSSKSKLVHEICKQLQTLKHIHGHQGKNEDTPDEIYVKYICIVAGIPNDASLWLITLCLTYFPALSTNLKEKMEESDVSMSLLNSMRDNDT